MPPTPKRKRQLQANMNKARTIKLQNFVKNDSMAPPSPEKSIKTAQIIAAASKRKTKKLSSNPFSRLMRARKQSLKMKKNRERDRLRKLNEAKKKSVNLVVQKDEEKVSQHNTDEEIETMDFHMCDDFVPVVTIDDENADITSTAATNEDNEKESFVFRPKKHIKHIKKRSMFYRIRKLREIAEEMTGGAAYVNTPNQQQMWPLKKQAELLYARKLTSRQINHLATITKKCHSYKTLMKKLKPIIEKFPITLDADGKLNISMIQSMKERLQNMVHKLPRNRRIRVTIIADKGEKITKICYYFNDVEKPQTTENLGILSFYIGDDDSETIKNVCEALNVEITDLVNNGMIIDGVRRDFEFFISGDCKSICAMLGVQGGRAIKFCHHCLSTDYCSSAETRTIERITVDAHRIVHLIASRGLVISQINQIRTIRKNNNSVLHEPFFPRIDHRHVIPPALHLLMALVNKLIVYFENSRLLEIIKNLKVQPIQGRTEYNGNGCRKIIKYFMQNKPQSVKEISMFHFFKRAGELQRFAVARSLTLKEIYECEDVVRRLFDDLDGLAGFKFNNKLHILRFHLIPFIKIHGSWGIFSEQGIERLHCIVNQYRKRISSKSEMKRNVYALKMLILGTYFFDLS